MTLILRFRHLYKPKNKSGFGMGIVDGIGIEAHPDRLNPIKIKNAIKIRKLSLFFNSKVSPLDFYYTAQYKGFCDPFPATSQDA